LTLHTHAGSLPTHKYVWIEPRAIGDHGWLRAVWFGLASFPGRAWGCHVMLESGAVYRNVPLHQLASHNDVDEPWTPAQAQTAAPEQSKEFYFIQLENGRFTAQPTNHVLVEDRSFTRKEMGWPDFLRRQEDWYSAEDGA